MIAVILVSKYLTSYEIWNNFIFSTETCFQNFLTLSYSKLRKLDFPLNFATMFKVRVFIFLLLTQTVKSNKRTFQLKIEKNTQLSIQT